MCPPLLKQTPPPALSFVLPSRALHNVLAILAIDSLGCFSEHKIFSRNASFSVVEYNYLHLLILILEYCNVMILDYFYYYIVRCFFPTSE